MLNSVSPVASSRPPVNGAHLGHRLRKMSPAARAFLAFDISTGAASIARFSQKRAAKICGASSSYVETISRLSPTERAAARANPKMLWRLHKRRRELTDAELDVLVASNPERVMAAVDRYTAPIAAE